MNLLINLSLADKYELENVHDERPLTREEAAAIAVNLSQVYDGFIQDEYGDIAAGIFQDAQLFSGIYFARQAGKAAVLGLVQGVPGGYFQPKDDLTRAEAVTILSRIHDRSLRKPANIDLEDYPHAVIPVGDGFPEQVFIFSSDRQKEVYHSLSEAKHLTNGAYLQQSTTFYFYENDEVLRAWLDGEFGDTGMVHDMAITLEAAGISMAIKAVEGTLSRHEKVLDSLLEGLFGDGVDGDQGIPTGQYHESVSQARQFIVDNYSMVRENRPPDHYSEQLIVGQFTVRLNYVLDEPVITILIQEAED